jgi:hypothetical protein
MFPDFQQNIPFLEGSQALPVCPSGKSNMWREGGVWDIGGIIIIRKTKYLDWNLYQCCFFYHKYRLDSPGIGLGSLRSERRDMVGL